MAIEPNEIIDNQENQEVPEEVLAAPEGEQQAEPEEEKKVPLAALRESRAKLKAEREEKQQLALRVAQMEGYLASMQQGNQRQQAAPKNYDPEVYALIKPILEEEMSPAKAEIAALKASLEQERAMRTFEQKKSFVLNELPFLDEIREELAERINAMSPDEQAAFENSPIALVTLAKSIHASKGGKVDPAVKQAAKAAAKGISGTAPGSKHADTTRTVNPLEMSREDFAKRFKGFLD